LQAAEFGCWKPRSAPQALTEVEALVHCVRNQSQEHELVSSQQQEDLDEVGMRRWLIEIETGQNLS